MLMTAICVVSLLLVSQQIISIKLYTHTKTPHDENLPVPEPPENGLAF